MATNQTPHYALSQWLGTDAVVRADFNADNQKVDSALHSIQTSKADAADLTAALTSLTARIEALETGNRLVLLATRSIKVATTLANISLLRVSLYRELLVSYTLPVNGSRGQMLMLQLNGDESAVYTYGGLADTYTSPNTYRTAFTLSDDLLTSVSGRCTLFPFSTTGTCIQNISYTAVSHFQHTSHFNGACPNAHPFAELTSIRFTSESPMLPGGSISVYGLK